MLIFKDDNGNEIEKHKIKVTTINGTITVSLDYIKGLVKLPSIFHCLKDENDITLVPILYNNIWCFNLIKSKKVYNVFCYLPNEPKIESNCYRNLDTDIITSSGRRLALNPWHIPIQNYNLIYQYNPIYFPRCFNICIFLDNPTIDSNFVACLNRNGNKHPDYKRTKNCKKNYHPQNITVDDFYSIFGTNAKSVFYSNRRIGENFINNSCTCSVNLKEHFHLNHDSDGVICTSFNENTKFFGVNNYNTEYYYST